MTLRMASPPLLGWPLWASLGVHALAMAAVSSIVSLTPPAVPASSVPVEIVELAAPAPPPVPPPIRQRMPASARPTVARPLTTPEPVVQPSAPAPALLEESPRREPVSPAPELSDSGPRRFPGESSSGVPMPALSAHSSGGGTLLPAGDLPIAGTGGSAGGGGAALVGGGRNDNVQARPTGDGAGLTSFARPLGGYQTRPRYPDSARRQGIEGETLLRFHVLASGRVGEVSVTRSAGHEELDRAAVEAVKTWLFEPARRGKEPVSVWVTLPVRFRLQSGVAE